MAFKPYDLETRMAIRELKALKSKLGEESPEARIKFAATVFKFDLYDDIRSYELYDKYGISDRDFDTCFEMYDGSRIVHSVMKEALKNKIMESCIRSTGDGVWDSWLKTYKKEETQLDMFV